MKIVENTPQPMTYSTNIAKSTDARPIECRSFCTHGHSEDKYFRVGRRPTDGRSLDHHHSRKHAKTIEPHHMMTICCSRIHDVPVNPWHSSNIPRYARAATVFQLFDHLREKKPNVWRRPKSSEETVVKTMRRRPTGNHSLNYHHTRTHAKDVEPHCFKMLKCGRLHDIPVQQWNLSNQPDYKAANSTHRLFENIRERKLKPRNRQATETTNSTTTDLPNFAVTAPAVYLLLSTETGHPTTQNCSFQEPQLQQKNRHRPGHFPLRARIKRWQQQPQVPPETPPRLIPELDGDPADSGHRFRFEV